MSQLNFFYTQEELQNIAESIIKKSLQKGASAAQVELSEGISTDIEILNQQIENFETSHENQLSLTIFQGYKKGNVGVSSITLDKLDTVIQQALDIAKFTESDPANGLLEKEYIAQNMDLTLELYCPFQGNNQRLISDAKKIEQLALTKDSRITASDGSSISYTQYNFVTANSNDLNLGYTTSRYSSHISLIGENSSGMQTDYWYSSKRNYDDLLSNDVLAQTAVNRVLRRLDKGSFNQEKSKVIFESTIAKSLIGGLMSALSGGSLYRRLSFLNDSLNTQIFPAWLNISEDPFITRGLASCYFDNEGCKVVPRQIIENGVVKSYLLSAYSARRLNMQPTGNAGGNHNIIVSHNFSGNLEQLAHEMYSGIIIIETIGHGLNMVSGDYSVGAAGLVVINGKISHYTENLTISGNLQEIFKNINLIANDSDDSSIICGSILINEGVIRISA